MMVPRRCVVKIGSSSLTDAQSGQLLPDAIAFFVRELVSCMNQGIQCILVTSGAVAAGFGALGFRSRPQTIHEKQACAAVGQVLLMQAYNHALQQQGHIGAQLLLNRGDFSDRTRIRHAHATITELLQRGVLPILNENDTTSIAELAFGDNDRLSALVANVVQADRLFLITDTDGLYTADPRKNSHAQKVTRIAQIDQSIWDMAGEPGSAVGTGGMRSKIVAAQIAMDGGISVCIGQLTKPGDLWNNLLFRGDATVFDPLERTKSMKQQWISVLSIVQGMIIIDAGAIDALLHGRKSLLPVGVIGVRESFEPGDIVEVMNEQGTVLGRGIVNYAAWQLRAVAGCSTSEVAHRIDVVRLEVIHRDDWVPMTTPHVKGSDHP